MKLNDSVVMTYHFRTINIFPVYLFSEKVDFFLLENLEDIQLITARG